MPTYEYRCTNCGELTEAFQKMSDAPLTTCPHCGKETLTRILSGGAGVLYKGEGWYVTDYSGKSSGGKDTPSPGSKVTKSATPITPASSPAPDAAQSAAQRKSSPSTTGNSDKS